MVWTGVSYYGKTSLNFNADYYINNVLKPFLTKDVPRMFPGRGKVMVFYQDSASSRTAKKSTNFVR